jgi:hypothetical protein
MQPARLALLATSVAACSPKGEAALPSPSGAVRSDAVAPTSVPDGLAATDPAPERRAMVEALSLIPDDTEFVVALDVKAAVASEVGSFILHDFGPELRSAARGALDCGVPPEAWRFVIFAHKTFIPREEIRVFSGPGLGRGTTFRCIAEELGGFDDAVGMTREHGTLVWRGERDVLFVLSEDTVAIATDDWSDALAERIDGVGSAAIDGRLRKPMQSIDPTQDVLVIAHGPGGEAPEGFDFVTGGLTFESGPSFVALLHHATPGDAERSAAFLEAQWLQNKGIAVAVGVPFAAADRVQIDALDSAVRIRGRFEPHEFKTALLAFRTNFKGVF